MKTLPTPLDIMRRRRRRQTLLAGALTSVLLAASCGGTMNYSVDPQFTADTGITDGLDPLARGKRHFANRNFGLAIEAFEEARVMAPQSVNVLNALAVAYEEIGRSDLADSYFLEALDADAGSAQTYNNWAMVHLGRGNPAKAQQLLAEAARLAPSDPVVNENIARADAAAGTDVAADPDAPTSALATVIAELQPPAGDWAPTIRAVAPHVHLLQTLPPDAVPAAMTGGDGAVPTVFHPQVAAADIAPMPDPSEEQAPPPPAVPVSAVIAFDPDSPAAAEAALISLATAEAGRTIVPVGGSSAESDAAGGTVVRPGAAPAGAIVVAGADTMAPPVDPVDPFDPLDAMVFSRDAQLVSVELVPAKLPLPIAVGSWSERQDAATLSNDPGAGAGTFVEIATPSADAAVIVPGAGAQSMPSGAKFIGVGETVDPASLPARGAVVVPPGLAAAPAVEPVFAAVEQPAQTFEPVSAASRSPAQAFEPVSVASRSPAQAFEPVSAASQSPASEAAPVMLAALPDAEGGDSIVLRAVVAAEGDAFDLTVAATLPPLPAIPPVLADASARLPLIVAVMAAVEPVAPETAVADTSFGASLPLASAARLPSVVAALAMAEAGAEDGQDDAADHSDQ